MNVGIVFAPDGVGPVANVGPIGLGQKLPGTEKVTSKVRIDRAEEILKEWKR